MAACIYFSSFIDGFEALEFELFVSLFYCVMKLTIFNYFKMSRSNLEVIDNKVIPILVLCFLSHAQFETIILNELTKT